MAMEELFSPDELESLPGAVVAEGRNGQPGANGQPGSAINGQDGADGVDGQPGEDVIITNGTGTNESLLDLIVDLRDLKGAGFETVPEPYPDGPIGEVNPSLSDLYVI
jgi:hypothetical protein